MTCHTVYNKTFNCACSTEFLDFRCCLHTWINSSNINESFDYIDFLDDLYDLYDSVNFLK